MAGPVHWPQAERRTTFSARRARNPRQPC